MDHVNYRQRLEKIRENVKKHMRAYESLEEYVEDKTINLMFRIENLEDLKYKINQLEREIVAEKEKTAKKSSLSGLTENRIFKCFSQFSEKFISLLMSVFFLIAIYKLIKK